MMKTRTTGTLAAIGGLTATIALLTGLPTATADELADLRANQELLQRRIDQLAQGQPPAAGGIPGGGPGSALGAQATPGVAVGGGSFPRSFLIPGTDTSIRVGGFVDLTANYFFQGANTANPGLPSSNFGQNGNLNGVPVGQMFVPGLGNVAQQANHSRGNGFFEFSPQQSRLNVETRTPTAWGESRTFLEFDWSGSNAFSVQTAQQAGGDSLLPRLRFAYGTLGGFLAGQAISNFADADADTESMEFGGTMGSTGGQRIPQVRYTLAGPWGSAFSVAAEQPTVSVEGPGGLFANDSNTGGLPGGPGTGTISATCNGVPCTGAGTAVNGNIAKAIAPNLTVASYWAQPWGHVDFAGVLVPMQFNDGHFISRDYLGYGGHFSGDVKPGWFGWAKDDFLFSFIAGQGIGVYSSGGWANATGMATNFTVATACATPVPGCTGGMAASNVLFNPVFGWSTNGGYQHWWAPNLRSTIAAGIAQQDVNSQLIGPAQASTFTKEQWNAFANLVWNPVAFITAGVQYNYGTRVVVANGKGHAQAISAKFRVAF
ncbi:MAG: DcaP family trimeric outer membrane transporter [Stellaceae bacterium]